MKENKEETKEIKKEPKIHENKKKEDKELHEALEQNKKLAGDLKEANDRVLRLSAEIQNIGKRHSDEVVSLAKYEGIDLIKKIRENCNLKIELGGGIRDEKTIQMYLELGVDRLILGSIAVKNPEFVKKMA